VLFIGNTANLSLKEFEQKGNISLEEITVPGIWNREDLNAKHLHKTEPSRNKKNIFRSLVLPLKAGFNILRYT